MKFQITLNVTDDDGTHVYSGQFAQANNTTLAKLLNRVFVSMSAFDENTPVEVLTALSAASPVIESVACVYSWWDGVEPLQDAVIITVDPSRLNGSIDQDELRNELAISGVVVEEDDCDDEE